MNEQTDEQTALQYGPKAEHTDKQTKQSKKRLTVDDDDLHHGTEEEVEGL